ncbi:MAG: NAD(P)-dependent oxidoreductase, partial [Armatimonadota bacterium]|nr:NAD(P)-dependent oxidoreductase [Armatimonadota bacterium]
LTSLLASGYEVHAVSSKSLPEATGEVCWHQADLLDPAQVTALMAAVQPTHLLHFAWFVVPGAFWTAPENLRWVQASLDLLQAFARHGGERIVMAGTCAEYDWKYGYCSEDVTPLVPTTLYGTCKNALHMMLDAYAGQVGLSYAWGRIFFPYGPGEPPIRLVASVIQAILQGKTTHCSHGLQIRDFLHVQDVADAFVALLQSHVEGPVNIGSGCPVAIKEVVIKIAERLDRPDLLCLGAKPTPPDEPPLLVADVRRLRQEVGWSPQYDLDRGLKQTINWWKDRLPTHESS